MKDSHRVSECELNNLVSPTLQAHKSGIFVYCKYLPAVSALHPPLLLCPLKYHPCKRICLRNPAEANNTLYPSRPFSLINLKAAGDAAQKMFLRLWAVTACDTRLEDALQGGGEKNGKRLVGRTSAHSGSWSWIDSPKICDTLLARSLVGKKHLVKSLVQNTQLVFLTVLI